MNQLLKEVSLADKDFELILALERTLAKFRAKSYHPTLFYKEQGRLHNIRVCELIIGYYKKHHKLVANQRILATRLIDEGNKKEQL